MEAATTSPAPLLTKAEVAGLIALHLGTVDRLMARGELGFIRVGIRGVRFRPEVVETYLERQSRGRQELTSAAAKRPQDGGGDGRK